MSIFGIILQGEIKDTITITGFAILGVFACAVALEGYLKTETNSIERLFFFASSFLMIYHERSTSFAGLTVFIVIFAIHYYQFRKKRGKIETINAWTGRWTLAIIKSTQRTLVCSQIAQVNVSHSAIESKKGLIGAGIRVCYFV